MLGRTLLRRLGHYDCLPVDIEDGDICRVDDVDRLVRTFAPDVVIHCAAMTDVDGCEERTDQAWAVNALGAANVAIACYRHGVRLIAVSTDYVFSGQLDRPYHEFDATGPATVYGVTKLAGEIAIRSHCPDHLIVRTAWLYGQGGPSFFHTMLKLGKMDGPPVTVVDDQIGNPTSADALSAGLISLLESPIAGTVHLTCQGEATWFDFAREIFQLAALPRPLRPCKTSQFPRPAQRPANSRLENRLFRLHGLPAMPTWQQALKDFLKDHPDG